MSRSRENLDMIVARLRPILEPRGFETVPGDDGISSGGPFATIAFARPPLLIELIVREERLGLPNYQWDGVLAGHDDLVDALGRYDGTHLAWDHVAWQLVTTTGEPIVDALEFDLAAIVLPALEADPDAFRDAVHAAHRHFQRRLTGPDGPKRTQIE